MYNIFSSNRNSIISISIISLILLIFVTFLSINKYTIAPVWHLDDYPPWSENETLDFNNDHIYGYKHKGHDQIMQFFLNRSDSLRQHDLKRDKLYSDKMALGGQINSRIQFSYGLHGFFSKIINSFNKNKYFETILISKNFSTAVWMVLSFFVIFYLCQNIFGRSKYNYLYIFLFNPFFLVNAEEAWQMLILGTYCILLGIVLMNKNEKLIIQLANLILIGIGSILIIRANSHHYWLYFPISFLFFLPFLNNFLKFKKLLLVNLALFIGAVFSIQIIIDGLIAIQNSSSNIDMSPLSNLKKMEYPAFPLSYFIGLPLLHDFYNYLNINWPLNGIIPAGEGFFGPSMLILSIIGFLNIKNNYLRFGILLLLFYWIGPLQLFLRLVVGGPFITETSVGGRLGVYVYIILLTLSVHAIINNLNEIKKYNKLIYFYSFSVIIIQIIQFLLILSNDNLNINKIWLFGLISSISCISLIFSLMVKTHIARFFLLISLIIVPFYLTLSPYGIHSAYPHKIDKEIFNLENIFDFKVTHNDVGALAVEYKDEKYTKKPLPSNFWYFSKSRSINTFFTPLDKDFLYLYYYQYFSNWPSSIKSPYLIKLPGREVNERPTLSKLARGIHRHHSMSIPVYNNKFSYATERFFDLSGVSLIAAENYLSLNNENYTLIQQFKEINIWKRDLNVLPIRIVCNIVTLSNKIQNFEELLFNSDLDLSKVATGPKDINFNECEYNSKVIDYNFGHDYNIKINLANPSGVVVTNIVFNSDIEARDHEKKIEVFKCNGAFMCIIPSDVSNEIFLQYKKENTIKKLKSFFNGMEIF